MKYRKLGDSDLEVSEISLGSWLTYGVGVEADKARACLDAAFDVGMNFIDTANIYGRGAAETFLGEALTEFLLHFLQRHVTAFLDCSDLCDHVLGGHIRIAGNWKDGDVLGDLAGKALLIGFREVRTRDRREQRGFFAGAEVIVLLRKRVE